MPGRIKDDRRNKLARLRDAYFFFYPGESPGTVLYGAQLDRIASGSQAGNFGPVRSLLLRKHAVTAPAKGRCRTRSELQAELKPSQSVGSHFLPNRQIQLLCAKFFERAL